MGHRCRGFVAVFHFRLGARDYVAFVDTTRHAHGATPAPRNRRDAAPGARQNRPSKVLLVARRMLSGDVRQIPWRQKFYRDVLLSLDRPFVQESGPVMPLANGAHCSRKERGRAVHELYIQHLAELSDGGADLYGF